MALKRMALSEVKDSLSSVIQEVQAKREMIIITRHGHDVARLTPIGSPGAGRRRTYRKRSAVPGDFTQITEKDTTKAKARSGIPKPKSATWEDLNSVAERIRRDLPEGISAQDVMDDIRG